MWALQQLFAGWEQGAVGTENTKQTLGEKDRNAAALSTEGLESPVHTNGVGPAKCLLSTSDVLHTQQ